MDDNSPTFNDDAVMTAVRLTENAQESDVTPDKPAVLMICGVHAHEWMPQETCLGYIDWIVKAANGFQSSPEDTVYAQDLLAERELWFVVMANPAGRLIEDEGSTDGIPPRGGQRKNAQWDVDFTCTDEWVQAPGGGRCVLDSVNGINTGWVDEDGNESNWTGPGVNVGASFSHGWGNHESVPFGRDMIFDRPGELRGDIPPELFDCEGDPDKCRATFGDDTLHANCVERGTTPLGDPIYGCFLTNNATLSTCNNLVFDPAFGEREPAL